MTWAATDIQSPSASESIKVAFGVEKRFDRLKNVTDDPSSSVPPVRTGRPDDRHRRFHQGARSVHRSAASAGAGRAFRGPARDGAGVSLLRLRPDLTTDTYKVGLDWAPIAGRAVPRQLPACDSCAERRRAVHRAGLQPVRPDGRPVRSGPRPVRQTAAIG